MSPELITRIPGAAELVSWFGRYPRLHDGAVCDFALRRDRSGFVSVKGFRMNPETDEKGYFVLDKHCTVTYTFEGILEAEFSFEEEIDSIVDQIQISECEVGFEFVVDAVNGFDCAIRAKSLRISFEPNA
ncbi:MAG TPA: hypothetical protein VHW02_13305 [Rhizomicrobium sp.]|jgi:hypothetical protein|nr:hypothetical protein [Rhizomicrobium sp.]